MPDPLGAAPATIRTPPPGPRSRALAERLGRVESRNVTYLGEPGPIFWDAAHGANVRDVDGNIYIDLTAGFGVAAAGHAAATVTEAIAAQAQRLAHGLGDVHPSEPKVALLERLAELAPGELGVGVLGTGGAEAVEIALKTAVLYTGRPGALAFEGAYHGLSYGALAATWRDEFRAPFEAQLHRDVRFAPFPAEGATAVETEEALDAADRLVRDGAVGAVLVEPVQGRAGIIPPADGFLAGLRELCDRRGLLLIFDEIYTGLGRTGRWFACEHWDVVPDLLTVGKALTGSLPLSATLGSARVMEAWPPSRGEAMHTSTFMGNPVACAAALAQLERIETAGLVDRADRLGRTLARGLDAIAGRCGGSTRGLGLLRALSLPGNAAGRVAAAALRRGVLILPEGPDEDVLAITPPLTIAREQLDQAMALLDEAIEEVTNA